MNRLAQSTSPYLHQHADNPVDWYPWCEEALARAKQENKPILLSVGYSACHWCHVMAHESFEDQETANLMNAYFISIKVDREERPDIDAIYQKVTQLMGQGGGWPLTVFLTPEQEPFFGGTYFPKEPHYGRPAFRQVLVAMHEFFSSRPQETVEQAKRFMQGFAQLNQITGARTKYKENQMLESEQGLWLAGEKLLEYLDPEWGGLGHEPKFPNVPSLEILLHLSKYSKSESILSEREQTIFQHAAQGLFKTLEMMWRGGIYDHLRGGFARYSVDRQWLVPHFEKMLYDNAQLLGLYAQASVIWPRVPFLKTVVTETVQYLETDMQSLDGTFYSATDADSEGVEGKYFCWTRQEIEHVLLQVQPQPFSQQEIDHFLTAYGVTKAGNFHGQSILSLPQPLTKVATELNISETVLQDELTQMKQALLAHRYQRIPPLRDEKILTCWNALTISGLVHAASAAEMWGDVELHRRWLAMAKRTATILLKNHIREDGSVYRAAFAKHVHTQGYLDDIASLARACLDLHEHTLESMWIWHAQKLAQHAVDNYLRSERDGFYMTAATATPLIERIENNMDSALPSGLGMMLEVLLRLDAQGHAPANTATIATSILKRFAHSVEQPMAFASLILAAQFSPQRGAMHISLHGQHREDLQNFAYEMRKLRVSNPRRVSIHFQNQQTQPQAIVCVGQSCSAPLRSLNELRHYLDSNNHALH